MRMIPPNPLKLVYSNVNQASESEWASGTTYASGDRVRVTLEEDGTTERTPHEIYESSVDSNTDNYPPDNSDKWTLIGATNRWKSLDAFVSSQTVLSKRAIEMRLSTSDLSEALAFFNLRGDSLRIDMLDTSGNKSGEYRNSILHSRDPSQSEWSGAASVALDAVGVDGRNNTAATITDSDAGAVQNRSQSVSVADDSEPHTLFAFVKKDSDTSRFPAFGASLSGGTALAHTVSLNTSDGSSSAIDSDGSHTVLDAGDFWQVVIHLTNNGSGNTTLTYTAEPARGGTLGGTDASITGSIVHDFAQIEIGSDTAHRRVRTDGNTVTVIATATIDLTFRDGITDWKLYFFEPFDTRRDSIYDVPIILKSALVDITVEQVGTNGDAKLGTVLIGPSRNIGATQYDARPGIQDFSRKDTNDFGETELVKRPFAKRQGVSLFVDNDVNGARSDFIARLLAANRATPLAWDGNNPDSDYESLIVFGFYKDFEVRITNFGLSQIDLDIEGLI